MANPHPRVFDHAARAKAVADVARMESLAALATCRAYAEQVRDTAGVMAREADRLLRRIERAYAARREADDCRPQTIEYVAPACPE